MKKIVHILIVVTFSLIAHATPYTSKSGYVKLSQNQFDLETLKAHCPYHELTVPHDEKSWQVADFSLIAESGGQQYYYQICRGVGAKKDRQVQAPQDNVAAFLYQRKGKSQQAQVIWGETAEMFGANWFDKAHINKIANFDVIVIPNPNTGNGGFNSDRYFELKDSKWALLDSESWKDKVRQQIPKGFELFNDIQPNLETMTFESPLWREGKDAHATPTGGRIHGTLVINDNSIALGSVTVDPATQQ